MTILHTSPLTVLAGIHAIGYWRVVMHPSTFNEHKIPTPQQCWEIAAAAQVGYRPYAVYPYLRERERDYEQDWVQYGGDSGQGLQFWRFYQSGQFIHHFAMSEDVLDEQGMRVLNALNTLYTLTEITKFASRLAFRDVLEPDALVRVELHNVEGRTLVGARGALLEGGPYAAGNDPVVWRATPSSLALIATSNEIAVDAAISMFAQFGWRDVSRDLLLKEQRRFLKGQC